jgi:hypothetical protein
MEPTWDNMLGPIEDGDLAMPPAHDDPYGTGVVSMSMVCDTGMCWRGYRCSGRVLTLTTDNETACQHVCHDKEN